MADRTIAELTQHLNSLEFPEYSKVGWCKAIPLTDEGIGADLFSDGRSRLHDLLNRLRDSPRSLEVHRELIEFFLTEWIIYNTPESSCAHSADVSLYTAESRSSALAVVDSIIAQSVETHDKEEREREWWCPPEECVEIDYRQLREWFFEHLFNDASSCFYVRRPPKELIEQYGFIQHDVIGISPWVIAMFWI